jgi:hypothetical protein
MASTSLVRRIHDFKKERCSSKSLKIPRNLKEDDIVESFFPPNLAIKYDDFNPEAFQNFHFDIHFGQLYLASTRVEGRF